MVGTWDTEGSTTNAKFDNFNVWNPVYTYDANGNMTSDGHKCYEFNEANQLKKAKACDGSQTIAEYVYDYSGNRMVKKVYEGGALKETVTSLGDHYETKVIAGGATENTAYYWVNGQLIAKKDNAGTKTYFHNDHLGSASVITNQAGSLVEQTNYGPWGEIKTGGTKSKFLYTGQEHDQETELNYYNARYYNDHIRRFTQPDFVIQDVYNPQDLNRYSYVRNNPVKYTDPSGNVAWIPIIIIGGGAALGATEAIMTYSLDNPNATLQQKIMVGASGAVTGSVVSATALYAGTSMIAVAAVSGGSSMFHQMTVNSVNKQSVLQSNVLTQGTLGAVTNVGVAKLTKAANLVPNNVGRPATINKDRGFIETFNANKLNALAKALAPDTISTNVKVMAASVTTFFTNLFKDDKKNK